eukprot:3874010-Heterocapsa_arctica.AAC.1
MAARLAPANLSLSRFRGVAAGSVLKRTGMPLDCLNRDAPVALELAAGSVHKRTGMPLDCLNRDALVALELAAGS